jgi:hypothetical protein
VCRAPGMCTGTRRAGLWFSVWIDPIATGRRIWGRRTVRRVAPEVFSNRLYVPTRVQRQRRASRCTSTTISATLKRSVHLTSRALVLPDTVTGVRRSLLLLSAFAKRSGLVPRYSMRPFAQVDKPIDGGHDGRSADRIAESFRLACWTRVLSHLTAAAPRVCVGLAGKPESTRGRSIRLTAFGWRRERLLREGAIPPAAFVPCSQLPASLFLLRKDFFDSFHDRPFAIV